MATRGKILALLEENRERYYSGEELARLLGVSRTAVWKAVKELQKQGYAIDGVTNKGYSLLGANEIISPEGIALWLDKPQRAEHIHAHTALASTNLAARRLALEGAPDGTVIIADSQTEGRGRRGRAFYSPPGTGLYMSVLVRMKSLEAQRAPLLTVAASVAVCRAIAQATGVEVGIKWVNDIYLGGRKIAGLLTEASTSLENGMVEWAVLGIGLNCFPPAGGFPPELWQTAGALLKEAPGGLRNKLAGLLLNELDGLEGRLEESRWEQAFLEEYRRRSVVIGKPVTVTGPEGQYEGTAQAIDSRGRLVVERRDGKVKSLVSGEVSIRLN